MPEDALITATAAGQILKKHDLCERCLYRLFAEKFRPPSNRLLEKKLNRKQKIFRCHVCRNLFDGLDRYVKMMIDSSSEFSFSTFSVGAILKPSMIDRDDAIRSTCRLRGTSGVKTDITKQLAKSYSAHTKKILDPLDPDVTFTVNTRDESCQLRSKSILLSGRYVKNSRNFSQKQKPCSNCLGKGCRTCNFHGIAGFESVEGAISELLFKKIGCTTAKFTWIGGEDKSSLVLGTGRPFFVRLQNPLKQRIRPLSKGDGPVTITDLKIATNLPLRPIKFSSKIEIQISTDSKITSAQLERMNQLQSTLVAVCDRSGKRTEKKISSVSYEILSDQKFNLTVNAEGGLPIKRFVSGDGVVPSVSSVLKMRCNANEFDFLDVQIDDNN